MSRLTELGKEHKILKPWTDLVEQWANKYYIKMDETNAYVITLCKT